MNRNVLLMVYKIWVKQNGYGTIVFKIRIQYLLTPRNLYVMFNSNVPKLKVGPHEILAPIMTLSPGLENMKNQILTL